MDREKVIKGIECCITNRTRCFDKNNKLCPYFGEKYLDCTSELLSDVLSVLKEQEQEINFLKSMQLQTTKGMSEQELGNMIGKTLGLF